MPIEGQGGGEVSGRGGAEREGLLLLEENTPLAATTGSSKHGDSGIRGARGKGRGAGGRQAGTHSRSGRGSEPEHEGGVRGGKVKGEGEASRG